MDAAVDAPSTCSPQTIVDPITPTTGSVSTSFTMTATDLAQDGPGGTRGFGDAPGKVMLLSRGEDPYQTEWPFEATVKSWTVKHIVAVIPDVPYSGEYWVKVVTACGDTVSPVPTINNDASPPVITVVMPPRIYVHANANDANGHDTITTLAYDAATGAVTQLGAPTSLGMPALGAPGCSRTVFLEDGGRRLYVSGATGVAAFDVDPTDGTLSPIPGSPFLSGSSGAHGMQIAWDGEHYRVWLMHDSGALVTWIIDDSTGALAQRSSYQVAPGDDLALLGSGSGSRLYSNGRDGTVAGYATDPTATPPSVTALPASPYGTPSATASSFGISAAYPSMLLVPSTSGLALWNVDPTTGVPAEAAGSPFTSIEPPSGAMEMPAAVEWSIPGTGYDGIGSVMGAWGSGYVVGFAINSGVPTALSGSPWNVGLSNVSCVGMISDDVSPSPRVLALDAGNKRVGIYDYDPEHGTMTPVSGSPFSFDASELANGFAATTMSLPP